MSSALNRMIAAKRFGELVEQPCIIGKRYGGSVFVSLGKKVSTWGYNGSSGEEWQVEGRTFVGDFNQLVKSLLAQQREAQELTVAFGRRQLSARLDK